MKGVIPIKNNHHPLDKIEKWLVFTGYAAFVWSTLFTLIHVYWAAGGTLGFEGKTMGKALFIINLVAIALCIIAAFTALMGTKVLILAVAHFSMGSMCGFRFAGVCRNHSKLIGFRITFFTTGNY